MNKLTINELQDYDFDAKYALAYSVDTPSFILEELSKDKDIEIREAVAGNLNTPGHVLEKLSKDEHGYIPEKVAYNSSTPGHVLEELSKMTEPKRKPIGIVYSVSSIITDITENPNTPGHVLEELAKKELLKDKEERNRSYRLKNIAKNPNTPSHVLEELSKIGDEVIDECIKRNPKRKKETKQLVKDYANKIHDYYKNKVDELNNEPNALPLNKELINKYTNDWNTFAKAYINCKCVLDRLNLVYEKDNELSNNISCIVDPNRYKQICARSNKQR